jgi:type IV secretory pathway VirB10-like protein
MSVATMGSPMNNRAPDAEGEGQGKTALWVVLGLMALALVAYGISQIKLSSGVGKPRQQTVKIMLPDAPPPPPPKVEEKRPEPKPDNKPQPQQEQKPQPVQAEPQQLKMEGAAGNGPSAFSAGNVSSDYKGGAVGTGQAPVNAGPTADERRKAQFYANNIRRQLKEELERHLDSDEPKLEVTFAIWIAADGHLSKYELQPTGNAQADADARRAFEEAAKSMRLERPGDVLQPLRMKLQLLPNG